MPGFILHEGATVMCAHGGSAEPTEVSTSVFVGGQPVTTQAAPYTIAGCSFNISGSPSPCITAQWTVASTQVFVDGLPVLLLDSQATCIPNGTPLIISTTQTQVTAT
jgi:hypothetical protein